jgi:hypothetical protein
MGGASLPQSRKVAVGKGKEAAHKRHLHSSTSSSMIPYEGNNADSQRVYANCERYETDGHVEQSHFLLRLSEIVTEDHKPQGLDTQFRKQVHKALLEPLEPLVPLEQDEELVELVVSEP